MELAEKLKAIRAKERVTQSEFCELLGFSLNTYKKYEASMYEMGFAAVSKLVNHPRFMKYTLWLMIDQVAPECGQVSPV